MSGSNKKQVTGEYVCLDGEPYFRIGNSNRMPDFVMSLVGAGDHWMFVSSNGSLTAGRQSADNALFPYAADDQISAARSETGALTLVRSPECGGDAWAPFTDSHASDETITRNLYKNALGTKLVFEEVNHALGLAFRYRWVFSERFGFIRSCRLENCSDRVVSLDLLDGLQNVLPWGVSSEFIMRFSNLSNAYKKSELVAGANLALYLLSSIPTDRAEPSESLKTTTVWQTGLSPDAVLLSRDQIAAFRLGKPITTESDVRGKSGAFLCRSSVELSPGSSIAWHVIAEVGQDHSDVIALREWLCTQPDVAEAIEADISASEARFAQLLSSSDGMQRTASLRRSNRHLSNTVFNVMRGGIPLENDIVHLDDFLHHVAGFNQPAHDRNAELLTALPPTISARALREQIDTCGDPDLQRLAMEYLPLAFSRRHGDPTRPWNRFSINLRTDSGRTSLDYQGNWRDIFQNWEALSVSYPEFSTAMVCRFLNATTADGYNPYRVTKSGFEWEEPTPEDPWANIGYWGDHQIIYLLKLLERTSASDPSALDSLLNSAVFVHANVPYQIRPFDEMRRDPRSTIDFDELRSHQISSLVSNIGADGKLLHDQTGELHRVTLLEKLLTLSLAKMSNFVPDGGIWLNTQRPEWNDANNALVGNGLSMVTACYLHRWFQFLEDWLSRAPVQSSEVSTEVADFLDRIGSILTAHSAVEGQATTPERRATLVETLSRAGSEYRHHLYESGVTGQTSEVDHADCVLFFAEARRHLAATIRNNERSDGLFHAYNLLDWQGDRLQVEHLYEMLEGQVAALSAGILSPSEAVAVLDALRESALFRSNQQSYLLYPDRQLAAFLDRNVLPPERVAQSPLLQHLLEDENEQIIRRDVVGDVHFHGEFRNSAELQAGLDDLPAQYASALERERDSLTQLFEDMFEHRQFTGRSGTFFAYEGLGSIYWHMVSKLSLAVSELFFAAVTSNADTATIDALRHHYRAIQQGIGAEKTPSEYGAFPTDPYSHTPENAGVKQPGMTGQVKEDILSRFAELGAHMVDGRLHFRFDLFDHDELLEEPGELTYWNQDGELESVSIPAAGFAFTLCQVPVVCQAGDTESIRIVRSDGELDTIDSLQLDAETSRQLCHRTGAIRRIECSFRR